MAINFHIGKNFNHIIRELRAENSVVNLKRYEDVQGFLRDKSFALCTSVVEGHPNALLEAMAVGIKPIIHNFPGAKELFPPELVYNTPEEAIEILLGKYNAQEYRYYVEAHYDMNIVYKKIEELF